jgi:hypothetical protein
VVIFNEPPGGTRLEPPPPPAPGWLAGVPSKIAYARWPPPPPPWSPPPPPAPLPQRLGGAVARVCRFGRLGLVGNCPPGRSRSAEADHFVVQRELVAVGSSQLELDYGAVPLEKEGQEVGQRALAGKSPEAKR